MAPNYRESMRLISEARRARQRHREIVDHLILIGVLTCAVTLILLITWGGLK